jgi:signal transduction histidine kinase
MNDGVIAVNMEGVISRFNRAAAVILGYEAQEVVGRAFDDVFGRSFHAPKYAVDMTLLARSGRRIPVHERDADIAGPDGKRLGGVKVFQDLSELHALREQARQQERLAAIGEMAATVAHEIRNPLGGIRGFAAFLAQDLEKDEPKKRLVEKILEGANRLDGIVSELLEYARPIELQLKPVNVARILESALSMLAYDAQRITIEPQLDADFKALADADKMVRVFLNLLINAVQSISGPGHIAVLIEGDERHVAVVVQDTGCGMDAGTMERIFSPFFTTKERGAGLGLSISAQIVEGHSSTIQVESAPGEGATMRVVLPRAE